ncbi:c-type cytochrome [Vibrio alfacsensis]|uniref:c-type cytochrome n=1 Tax=Vibrio alfacsensis TaxID=1074311 RepID=UPI0040675C68
MICISKFLLNTFVTLLFSVFFISLAWSSTEDLITENQCESCHGPNGVSSNTNIPSIAGIPEFNHVDQMLRYLEGRPAATVNYVYGDTSQKGDMVGVVKALTEAQIEQIAKYYSGIEFVRADQPFDEALAEKGKAIHLKSCENCHAEGGSDPFDEASILAGQQKGYLLTTLQQFNQGKRSVDKQMDDVIKSLSSEDLRALSEYYASFR